MARVKVKTDDQETATYFSDSCKRNKPLQPILGVNLEEKTLRLILQLFVMPIISPGGRVNLWRL